MAAGVAGRCGVLSLRHSIVLPAVRATESSPSRHPFASGCQRGGHS